MRTITTISEGYKEICDLTNPYMPKDLIRKQIDKKEFANFGTKDFNWFCHQMLKNILDEIKKMEHEDIIFQIDSDVIINSPIEWFEEQMKDNDMMFQNDGGTPCLGFFMVRVNDKTLKVMQEVYDNQTEYENFQETFNRLTFDIKYDMFDTKDVWNYGVLNKGIWSGEDFTFPEGIKAFHANFTIGLENKKKLLNKFIHSLHN